MTDLFRSYLGETPLTEDEKQGLIPSLATQGELNEFEFANIVSATRWAIMSNCCVSLVPGKFNDLTPSLWCEQSGRKTV